MKIGGYGKQLLQAGGGFCKDGFKFFAAVGERSDVIVHRVTQVILYGEVQLRRTWSKTDPHTSCKVMARQELTKVPECLNNKKLGFNQVLTANNICVCLNRKIPLGFGTRFLNLTIKQYRVKPSAKTRPHHAIGVTSTKNQVNGRRLRSRAAQNLS